MFGPAESGVVARTVLHRRDIREPPRLTSDCAGYPFTQGNPDIVDYRTVEIGGGITDDKVLIVFTVFTSP
jgi:hypothetical protein